MKTKAILLVAVAAVATLSFTFASVKNGKELKSSNTEVATSSAPAGGFTAEEIVK